MDWSEQEDRVLNGRAEAGFLITPVRVHVSSVKANLMGGELLGDMDVTNWQNSLAAAPEPRAASRRGPDGADKHATRIGSRANRRISAGAGLELLSTKSLPLDRMNFASNASGTVDLLWVGSIRDAETRVKINLSSPQQVAVSEVPLRGQADSVYHGSRDELEVGALHLATNSSDITAAGSLSSTSSMRFTLTSHNVKEWTPVLEAAYGPSKSAVCDSWLGQPDGNRVGPGLGAYVEREP